MITVKELLDNAIFFEEKSLTYYILHLLQTGKVKENDTDLDFNLANHQEVAQMIENNPLNIEKVGIYALKRNSRVFAFIYAKNEIEAKKHFKNLFQQEPSNCHEYPLDYEISIGNDFKTFRELRKQFDSFPAFLGIYERG